MTSRLSTHSGHCQACNSLQKLPAGRLSKHGYQVAGFGYFAGVCRGADYPAFEESKDLIEKLIADVTEERKRLEAWATELRVPATGRKAWVHEYIPDRRFGGMYVWREIEIVGDLRATDYGFSTSDLGWTDVKGVVRNLYREGGSISGLVAKKIEDVATHLNGLRAKAVDAEAKKAADYVVWQKGRIKNWKPRPDLLVPVKR